MFECASESSLKCHDHKSKNTALLTLPGPYHVETNPLICKENQWTGFYMIGASILAELKLNPAASCAILKI